MKRVENRKKMWKKKHLKKEQINLRLNQSEKNMIVALMYLGHYRSMSEAILSAVAHELEDMPQCGRRYRICDCRRFPDQDVRRLIWAETLAPYREIRSFFAASAGESGREKARRINVLTFFDKRYEKSLTKPLYSDRVCMWLALVDIEC